MVINLKQFSGFAPSLPLLLFITFDNAFHMSNLHLNTSILGRLTKFLFRMMVKIRVKAETLSARRLSIAITLGSCWISSSVKLRSWDSTWLRSWWMLKILTIRITWDLHLWLKLSFFHIFQAFNNVSSIRTIRANKLEEIKFSQKQLELHRVTQTVTNFVWLSSIFRTSDSREMSLILNNSYIVFMVTIDDRRALRAPAFTRILTSSWTRTFSILSLTRTQI